jgi:hypothetical protein
MMFHPDFTNSGVMRVNGRGTDDVGDYGLEGTYRMDNGRLCMAKMYVLGTGDAS